MIHDDLMIVGKLDTAALSDGSIIFNLEDFCRLSRIATKYVLQMPQLRKMAEQRRRALRNQEVEKYKAFVFGASNIK